jgi:hypothetical protein
MPNYSYGQDTLKKYSTAGTLKAGLCKKYTDLSENHHGRIPSFE